MLEIVLASALSASAPAVYGAGNESCGSWMRAHETDSIEQVAFSAWLSGFISGVNLAGSSPNVLEHTDMEGAAQWVSNYCERHPLEKVRTAALMLLIALDD